MILYDNFPPYTWGKTETDRFEKIKFRQWFTDYEKWKNTKSDKVKKRLFKKWSKKPKSIYYQKRGSFKGYKKRK